MNKYYAIFKKNTSFADKIMPVYAGSYTLASNKLNRLYTYMIEKILTENELIDLGFDVYETVEYGDNCVLINDTR